MSKVVGGEQRKNPSGAERRHFSPIQNILDIVVVDTLLSTETVSQYNTI